MTTYVQAHGRRHGRRPAGPLTGVNPPRVTSLAGYRHPRAAASGAEGAAVARRGRPLGG